MNLNLKPAVEVPRCDHACQGIAWSAMCSVQHVLPSGLASWTHSCSSWTHSEGPYMVPPSQFMLGSDSSISLPRGVSCHAKEQKAVGGAEGEAICDSIHPCKHQQGWPGFV